MAKKKEFESIVSVTTMDKYMKEHPVENKKVALGDMEIVVKPYIGASDFADIVNSVVVGCFDVDEESGEQMYQPYFRSFLFNMMIIEKYTNIHLPKDYAARYDVIRYLDSVGVLDQIIECIDENHFRDLDGSVWSGIDFMENSGRRAAEESIVYMGARLKALWLYLQDVVGKMDGLADVLNDKEAMDKIVEILSGAAENEPAEEPKEEDVQYEDGDRVIPMPDRK